MGELVIRVYADRSEVQRILQGVESGIEGPASDVEFDGYPVSLELDDSGHVTVAGLEDEEEPLDF